VDGVNDLGVVDALLLDRRVAEVAVTELVLDHDQRHAFVSQDDGERAQPRPGGGYGRPVARRKQ
jgi:hypothetical protein